MDMPERTVLQKLAVDFGEQALRLTDPFAMGWELPVAESMVPDVINSARNPDLAELVEGLTETAHEMSRQIFKSANYWGAEGVNHDADVLALRLYGHDGSSMHTEFNGAFSACVSGRRVPDLSVVNKFLSLSASLKLLGITMAYLASGGDERFLSEIPVSAAEYLLRSASRSDVRVSANATVTRISSAEYTCLYQLAKNAPAAVTISVGKTGLYRVLSATDQGAGILDTEGNPLREEALPQLFDCFTTKGAGHGFGLQAVKALAHLMNGYVAVATRVEGNAPLSCNTGREMCPDIRAPSPHGTTFALYLPE